jgi:hypothetical protein
LRNIPDLAAFEQQSAHDAAQRQDETADGG